MDKKKMDKERLRVVTVYVSEATYRRLKLISASTDMSNAEIVAKAIDMLDVHGVHHVKPAKVKATKDTDNTTGVDWMQALKPAPGERSISEPWQPMNKDKQVEPDLSKVTSGKRGGR